eukprot:1993973-Prymnesium_polylepis.2
MRLSSSGRGRGRAGAKFRVFRIIRDAISRLCPHSGGRASAVSRGVAPTRGYSFPGARGGGAARRAFLDTVKSDGL